MVITSKLRRVAGLRISLLGLALLIGVLPAARGVAEPFTLVRNVKQFTVAGIPVLLRPSDPANHVIVAKLFIRGGTTALPEGVSPAIEALSLEIPSLSGPKGMDRAAYQRQIQRMYIGIQPAQGRDFSTLTLRCVDEQFNPSWDLFAGVITQPQFDPVELRNAKDRSLSALKNRQINPEAYANYLADSAFFYGHPYGRFAQEKDIPPITAAILADHYKELFVKSRLLLVVVGNVDSADLYRKITSSLGKLPQGNYREPLVPVPKNAKTPMLIVRPTAGRAVTNYIAARYLAPNRNDSLYYPMMRLLSFVSGSLFREVRIERNLSYAPDADVTFANTSYGDVTISTTLPDSAWRVARGQVIDFFRDYVIKDEFLKSGLSSWITSNYMREQTNESQANELGRAQIYTGSWTNAFGVVEGVSDVTPEQMNLAAQRYLKNFTIVVVGDPSSVTPAEFLPAATTGGGSSLHHGK
ncbi:MAG: pitrilysin family protein [Candidatus Kapaibacterium sp.]